MDAEAVLVALLSEVDVAGFVAMMFSGWTDGMMRIKLRAMYLGLYEANGVKVNHECTG